MQNSSRTILMLAAAGVTYLLVPASFAGITALATENFTLGSSSNPGGNTITSLNNPVANGAGGYAISALNSHTGSNQTYFVYGNPTGGVPAALVTQGAVTSGGTTLADYSFAGIGQFSLANDGTVLYTMTSTRVNNVAPSLNALLVQTPGNSGPNIITYDGLQIGGTSAYASKYYGYNQSTNSIATLSSARITQGDDAYFFIDGVSDTYRGTQTGAAIFLATPTNLSASPILKSGDSIAGTASLTVGATNGSIDTSNFAISASGINYIDKVITNTGSSMLVTGTPSGGATKFITLGSTATGAVSGETWTSFGRAAINDVGTTAIAAGVSSGGYAVAINGIVQFESGSTIPVGGGGSVTLGANTSPNPDIKLNSNGDYATIYADYPAPGPGTQAKGKVIFDGTDIADTGAMIDTNGDGTPDTALTSVNVGRGISLGDLQPNGSIDLYFFGSINGNTTNILLRDRLWVGDANLDGKVDASDYSRIDNGYLLQLTGWINGDFNHDGTIDGSDYTLIDNAFNTQPAATSITTTSEIATPTVQIAAGTSVPEPGSMAAVGAAIVALSRRNRVCRMANK